MNNKTRHQAGAPASKGGEFKPQDHSESDITLAPEMSARQLRFATSIRDAEEISADFRWDRSDGYRMVRTVAIPADEHTGEPAHRLRAMMSSWRRQTRNPNFVKYDISCEAQVWVPSAGWVQVDQVTGQDYALLGIPIPAVTSDYGNNGECEQSARNLIDVHLAKALSIVRA